MRIAHRTGLVLLALGAVGAGPLTGAPRVAALADTVGAWIPTTPLNSPGFEGTGGTAPVVLDPPFCHRPSPPPRYPCGKVLVYGGFDVNNPGGNSQLAHLYDPVTESWSPTGLMVHSNYSEVGILLHNGKVLVVGTLNDGVSPTDGQLYDPIAGTWSGSHGSIPTAPRKLEQNTLTLLPDGPPSVCGTNCGRVLLVGSADRSDHSAALYDPRSDTWTATYPTIFIHTRATANLLPNGRVLIVAGGATDVATNTAELFDPVSSQFVPTGLLHTPRVGAGSALIPAGAGCGANCGKVVVFGGDCSTPANFVGKTVPPCPPARTLSSVEIYDPTTGVWSDTFPMQQARNFVSAEVMADGTVLVTGWGTNGLTKPEVYDPAATVATAAWRYTGPIAAPRDTAPALLSAGPVSACGANCNNVLWAGGYPGFTTADLYGSPPTATPVNRSGPLSGGTDVTLTGTGLAGVRRAGGSVTFGTQGAATITPDSNTPDLKVTVRSPAQTVAGPVAITVTTPFGSVLAGTFTYTPNGGCTTGCSPRLVVNAVVPPTGSTIGGTVVAIRGSGFTGATAVSFGGNSVAVTPDPTRPDAVVTAVSPPHAAGPVDVTVTTPSGSSALNPPSDWFTYFDPFVYTKQASARTLAGAGGGPSPTTGSGGGSNSAAPPGAGNTSGTPPGFGAGASSQTAPAHDPSGLASAPAVQVPGMMPAPGLAPVKERDPEAVPTHNMVRHERVQWPPAEVAVAVAGLFGCCPMLALWRRWSSTFRPAPRVAC